MSKDGIFLGSVVSCAYSTTERGFRSCPFCGNGAEIKTYSGKSRIFKKSIFTVYYIECPVCGCRTAIKETAIEAREAWNRRVDNE